MDAQVADRLSHPRTIVGIEVGTTVVEIEKLERRIRELDAIADSDRGVFLVGATSVPWALDPAFFRPGRFDRRIKVPLPDEESRTSIVRLLCERMPVVDLDVAAIVKLTKGFSGADLKAVFELAAEEALGRAMKEGRVIPLDAELLENCASRVKPSAANWEDRSRDAGWGKV